MDSVFVTAAAIDLTFFFSLVVTDSDAELVSAAVALALDVILST